MDGIFGIGPLELLFIAILALIVLGPERLPGVMREIAKYIRQFRRVGSELTAQFSEELKALDEINPRKILNDMTDPNRPDPDEPKIAAKPAAPVKPATPPPPKSTTKPAPARPAPARPAPAKPVVDTSTAAASESPAPEEAEHRILPPAPVEAQPQPASTFDNPGNGHAPAADPAVLANGAADGPENPA